MQSFLYVSSSIELEETTGRNALVSACVMELGKISEQGTFYEISEGVRMAKSLVGRPVYYGINLEGKHKKGLAVGIVESAHKVKQKIMATIRITDLGLIDKLKRGTRFLFSVGGIANIVETIRKAGRIIKKKLGCIMTHLQIVDADTNVGFPSAQIERVLEINESILLVDEMGLSAEELVLLHVNLSMF